MNSENFQNRSLRNIFGKFATGVCAVSYYNKDDKPIGITVNSFTSVSLDPALALWCIDNDSELYEEIIGKDKYIFNFLSEDQLNIAQLLSMKNNHNLNNIEVINQDFGLIFKSSCGETLFFGFLDTKPCRTIVKLPQKVSFGPEMCEIESKV